MPKALHDKLMKQARKMGLVGWNMDKYVYGTMAKVEKKKTAKKKRKKKNG